jgi:hypothetical protein
LVHALRSHMLVGGFRNDLLYLLRGESLILRLELADHSLQLLRSCILICAG